MVKKIHESQTSRQTDHGNVQFIAEASTLGWNPGEWPDEVEMTISADETIPFFKHHGVGQEDLVAMVYVGQFTGDRFELHILND